MPEAYITCRKANITRSAGAYITRAIGAPLPPFHQNCRCTTVPAIEEELPDLDDIEIEGDTPFDEWLKEYGGDLGVDTEGKTGDEIVEEIRQDNERAKGGENEPEAPSPGDNSPKRNAASDEVAQPKKTGYNIESEHLRDTLGDDACKAIEKALDKRPEYVRKIFKHFEDKLRVADLCDDPHDMVCSPSRGGVILNINAIVNGWGKYEPGDVALHELGHWIDHLMSLEAG
ncbi:MAG: hypothetical protein J6332_03305, partial [Abditibacteriota bacterium]|nr:hypothetical protein [Abditibacteriota bacterium]